MMIRTSIDKNQYINYLAAHANLPLDPRKIFFPFQISLPESPSKDLLTGHFIEALVELDMPTIDIVEVLELIECIDSDEYTELRAQLLDLVKQHAPKNPKVH